MNIPLRRYWDLLATHVKPQRGRFILLTVLLLGSIGLQVVNPQIMRYFIDNATSGGPSQGLALAAIAFIGLAIFQQVVGVSATYLGETVAWNATNALRAELAQHCLNLDMSFHNDRSPGELIERIDGDVAELSNFFSQLVRICQLHIKCLGLAWSPRQRGPGCFVPAVRGRLTACCLT